MRPHRGWKLLQSRENPALFDNIQDDLSSSFHTVDATAEMRAHISKFHQLKPDAAVSRRRLAPHLQHNHSGNYVNSEVFSWHSFVCNQFCHANVEEKVPPFKIYSKDKPTIFSVLEASEHTYLFQAAYPPNFVKHCFIAVWIVLLLLLLFFNYVQCP